MIPTILFRTEASHDVGLGHFKRCLLIAQFLTKSGFSCKFVVSKTDITQIRFLEAASLEWLSLPSSSLYVDEVGFYPTNRAVLIDLQHKNHVNDPAPLISLLRSLKESGQNVIFLDGLGDEAFRHPEAPPLFAYVQPYFGADTDPAPRCELWLKGPQYALLPTSIKPASNRCFPEQAENLLVTFGGSDPQEITLALLTNLLKSDGLKLKTRVILGPYFTRPHLSAVNSLIEQLRQKAWDIEAVVAPASMQSLFDWADLAIGSSGGTKYEFCANGLPFIFCSIAQSHIKSSEAFSSSGAGLHLGYFGAIESSTWLQSIESISRNRQKRESMSKLGRALIDGKGVIRLLCDLGLTDKPNQVQGHHK